MKRLIFAFLFLFSLSINAQYTLRTEFPDSVKCAVTLTIKSDFQESDSTVTIKSEDRIKVYKIWAKQVRSNGEIFYRCYDEDYHFYYIIKKNKKLTVDGNLKYIVYEYK